MVERKGINYQYTGSLVGGCESLPAVHSCFSGVAFVTGLPPSPAIGMNVIGKVKKIVECEVLLVELPGGRAGKIAITDVSDHYLGDPLRRFSVGVVLK